MPIENPNVMVEGIAFLLPIWELFASNLCPETICPA
jgi:hypothetical protein